MARNPSKTIGVSAKCSKCGNPLPLDGNGIPTSSIYMMGKWLCPDCKFGGSKNHLQTAGPKKAKDEGEGNSE